MVKGIGRKFVAAALLTFAVTACDDNPLAENREEAAYFRLNPSSVAVNAGGTVRVDAIVVNQYGAATNQAVTAAPCDAKISAVSDTARSPFEYPERFVITGNTLGNTCLVVSGGGLTDTISVRVVPASISVTGVDTVGSGETVMPSVVFRDVAGNPVTGFTMADVTFTSLTTAQAVVDSAGITGRAPGTGRVLAVLDPRFGVTRTDTATFVVRAGAFTGTISPNQAAYPGSRVTVNAGVLPFDTDTNVLFNGIPTFILARSASSITAVLPGGVTSTTTVDITNIGPNQVASRGSMSVTSPNSDPYEPNDDFPIARLIPNSDSTYHMTVSEDDPDDFFRIELPAARQVRFTVDWNDTGKLVTLLGFNAAEQFAYNACHTTGKPKTCTLSLPAGTTYINIWLYSVYPVGTFTGTAQWPAQTVSMRVEFL